MTATDTKSAPLILQVTVIVPLGRHLDYLPPQDGSVPAVGARVLVGLQGQHRIGIVVAHATQTEVAIEKLRAVQTVIDSDWIISDDLLQLLQWTSQYYHYPIGKVLHKTLPRLFREGNPVNKSVIKIWHARLSGIADKDLLKRAPKQKKLFEFLRDSPSDEETLRTNFAGWRQILRNLSKKDLVQSKESVVPTDQVAKVSPHTLNDEQAKAVEQMRASAGHFSCHLLEGITGSGKTEVYLQLAQQLIADGGQVMVLLPEISLASQTLRRFQERFGSVVAILHSRLSDKQRFNTWCKAALDEVKIIIGTRSVVFTPCANLKLIVIDEEHDLSYKQQETLRYHARDLAIKRAKLLNIPVILGSATPSLESLHNVLEKRYVQHYLNRRAGGAQLPKYQILDMRGQRLKAGLSSRLIEMMRQNLAQNEQVLLFLNRRGYSPKFLCRDCGTVAKCPRCELPMTYHLARNRLRCHHCEYQQPCPEFCSDCQSDNLHALGFGTERIEQELQQVFSNTPIVRIDADTTRRKGELEKRLEAVRRGDAKILIGTQMVSKGHHFPNVTLIGVINVDQRLFAMDFRALERLGQLIVQVSGRAGRGHLPGIVALQTYHPDNLELQCLIRQSYREFAKALLVQRQLNKMPPYRYLAVFRAAAKNEETPQHFLRAVATIMHRQQAEGIEFFGPIPAPIEKKIGFYRAQFILSAEQRPRLNRCLARSMPEIQQLSMAQRLSWHVDVDPMELE